MHKIVCVIMNDGACRKKEIGTPYSVVVDEKDTLTKGAIKFIERDSGSVVRCGAFISYLLLATLCHSLGTHGE